MKASDLPDLDVILKVAECVGAECDYPMDAGYHGGRPGYAFGDEEPARSHWANRWDLQKAFSDFPPKVVDAKLIRLVQRKLLTGCDGRHNCRGDFEVDTKGWEYLLGHAADREQVERLRRAAYRSPGAPPLSD